MYVRRPALRGASYLVIILFMLIMALQAQALTIVPSMTNIEDDFSKKQDFVITVINDGAKFENIRLSVDQYSSYLSRYITIEPSSFTLLANEKKNIQLSTRFPANLSPEKHDLIISVQTDDGPGPATIYSFEVKGTQIHNLKINEIRFNNVSNKESVYITLELNNKGNVIARSYPIIEFFKDGELIDSMQYKSLTMIMPGSKINLTLGYDLSGFDPGIYSIRSSLKYNQEHSTNQIERSLRIKEKIEKTENTGMIAFIKDNIFFIIFLVIVAIGSRILYSERKTIFERHLDNHKEFGGFEQRLDKASDSVNELIKDIDGFVSESNKWFKENFGDRYEFR